MDPVREGDWTEWTAGLEEKLKAKRDCRAREGGAEGQVKWSNYLHMLSTYILLQWILTSSTGVGSSQYF